MLEAVLPKTVYQPVWGTGGFLRCTTGREIFVRLTDANGVRHDCVLIELKD